MFTEKQGPLDELKPVTQEMLRDAYERASLYTEYTFSAGIAIKRAKAELETKVLVATFEGKIQGKNDADSEGSITSDNQQE